jgi:16S rRNA (guanine966-N2)-methyltransferase
MRKDRFMDKGKSHKKAAKPARTPQQSPPTVSGLRIVGGTYRGRRLNYSGDIRTRPMKDRLREAVFNLIGPSIVGKHALDLFAGTGALGLEALSRGADRATMIEQHNPTAGIIRENVALLGADQRAEVVVGNVFIWFRRKPTLGDKPWVVFCSPPYEFYVSRTDEMMELLLGLIDAAPAQSVFMVEADERFDFTTLPEPQAWDVRTYPPAVVGIFRKE